VDEIRAMTIRLLALLLIACLAHGQNAIFVKRGRTDGGSGIAGVPNPTFSNPFNDGTGDTSTSTLGDDCTPMTNHAWTEDPVSSGNFTLEADGLLTHAPCGTALDGLNDFSVSAWVNADSYGEGTIGLIVAKATDASNKSWSFFVNDLSGNGLLEFAVYNTVNAGDRFRSDANSFDACINVWCHVVAVVSGCTAMGCSGQLYIDGSPVNTNFIDATGTRRSDGADTVRIASYAGGTTFDGQIDDVRVWATTVLSDAQVADLFAEGRQ
jgi:hypothetical protein